MVAFSKNGCIMITSTKDREERIKMSKITHQFIRQIETNLRAEIKAAGGYEEWTNVTSPTLTDLHVNYTEYAKELDSIMDDILGDIMSDFM